jgi:hypothetical protein
MPLKRKHLKAVKLINVSPARAVGLLSDVPFGGRVASCSTRFIAVQVCFYVVYFSECLMRENFTLIKKFECVACFREDVSQCTCSNPWLIKFPVITSHGALSRRFLRQPRRSFSSYYKAETARFLVLFVFPKITVLFIITLFLSLRPLTFPFIHL